MSKGLWLTVLIIVAILVVVFWMMRSPATTGPDRAVSEDTALPLPTATIPEVTLPSGVDTPLPAGSLTATPASVSVTATGFSPGIVTVSAGGTVTFTNQDTVPHQVSSVPHPVHTNHPPLNGPVLGPGETFTVTFSKAGSFGYHDHLNPGLTGTIVVP